MVGRGRYLGVTVLVTVRPLTRTFFLTGLGLCASQLRRLASALRQALYCLRMFETNCVAIARLPVSERLSSAADAAVMPRTGMLVCWYTENSLMPSTLSLIPRKIATLPLLLPT